ncbi:MAG: hypothetical protein ACI8RZ_004497 [Myxococcota bacterium]|jgi:hypothetical protein
MLGLLLACTPSDTTADFTSGDLSEGTNPDTPHDPGDTIPLEDTGELEPVEMASAEADILIAVMLDTYRGDWMMDEGFTEPLASHLQDDGWSIYPASTTSNWTWPAIRLMATGCGFFSNLEDPQGSCEAFTVSEHSDQSVGDIPLLPSLINAKTFVLSNSLLWDDFHSDVCQNFNDQGGVCEVQKAQIDGLKGNDILIDRALELRDTLSAARDEHGKAVMFLHVFGPHEMYEYHPEFGECVLDTAMLPEDWEDFVIPRDTPLPELLSQIYQDENEQEFGAAQETLLSYYRCVYETDLAHTNAQVSRLLEGLGAEWMAENRAMVMLYNDHGEQWGEVHPDSSVPQSGIYANGHGRSVVYDNVTGGFGGMWIPWWEGTLPKTAEVHRLSAEDLWQTAFYHLNIDAPPRMEGVVIGTTPLDTPAFSAAVDVESQLALVRAVWHTDDGDRSLVCTLYLPGAVQCEGYENLDEYSDQLNGQPAWDSTTFGVVWPEMRQKLLSVGERQGWTGSLPE